MFKGCTGEKKALIKITHFMDYSISLEKNYNLGVAIFVNDLREF
jgi:hypothetical protein